MNKKRYIIFILGILLTCSGGQNRENGAGLKSRHREIPTIKPDLEGISTEPVLRINTEMHTAMVRRIGMDAGEKYLVSASHDKTIKAWEIVKTADGGYDLNLLKTLRPPIGEGNEGKLYAVAISPDGNTIVAGGLSVNPKKNDNINHSIYFFDRQSGRMFQRIDGMEAVILHLSFSGSGILYGAADPTLGGFGEKTQKLFLKPSSIADYRDGSPALSNSGDRFSFNFEQNSSYAIFDIEKKELVIDKLNQTILTPPIITSPEFIVSNWENYTRPLFNDNPIPLEEYERSRSLAIHPRGEGFLLGADWYLRYFDKTGRELWKTANPGAAWAVNISGDGRLALTAFGDGTIRWYRISDGKEILTFFPHADRKNWVL